MFWPEKSSVYLKYCRSTTLLTIILQQYIDLYIIIDMVIFYGWNILSNISKDILPMLATSNVMYKFVWCCDNSYVNKYLSEIRIRQYVPKYAMDLLHSRVFLMKKHVIRCAHRKRLAITLRFKYLSENKNCT